MNLRARLMLFFWIWPRDLEGAVTRVVRGLDADSKKLLCATPKEDLIDFHHGWGTHIRNRFGLWQGNTTLMNDCGATEPDEASMRIMEGVWNRLNKNWPC